MNEADEYSPGGAYDETSNPLSEFAGDNPFRIDPEVEISMLRQTSKELLAELLRHSPDPSYVMPLAAKQSAAVEESERKLDEWQERAHSFEHRMYDAEAALEDVREFRDKLIEERDHYRFHFDQQEQRAETAEAVLQEFITWCETVAAEEDSVIFDIYDHACEVLKPKEQKRL